MKFHELIGNADRPQIEDWCRSKTQQAYLGEHTALARVLGNHLMYVDTRDLSLAPHMLMNGYWEMWVTEAICNYVRPGMRCIDVGANCGYFTLLLAELVGEKGEVVAYEPVVEFVNLLRKTIEINGAPAQVLPRAASNARANKAFYVSEVYGGSGSLSRFDGSRPISGLQSGVATSKIDDDLGALRIDFVKIDVQGHEMEALEGMQGIISRATTIAIAMEFSPTEHPDPKASLEKIRSYGLTIRTIGTDGVVRPVASEDAILADTGDHRMLWLSKG
jgi:FkbM family methyltransferase